MSPRAGVTCVVVAGNGGTGDEGPAQLYAASYRRLVGIVGLVASDRAEAHDVVQEAFARLLPRWDQVGRYDDPEAWVRMVAFRLLSNRRRQARRLVLGDRGDGPDLPPPGSEAVDVARALAALPVVQRQVVVLHHLLDLSVEETAAELGIPVGTVKSRLFRARSALAPLLAEEVSDRA